VTEPRHRYLGVVEAVAEAASIPAEPLEAALYVLLSTGACDDTQVSYAYDIFQKPEHRAALDAFLLARIPADQTATTLEIPQAVIEVYRHLFMDVAVFRNRLEIQSYAAAYDGEEYGRELVRAAVMLGLEYLLWAFGKPDANLDNRSVVRRTMVDAFMRGMAHKGNAITSATAKEAQKWWSTAIRNAQILEEIDPRTARSAYDELKMALEKKDDTLTVEQSPVPIGEILR
jgi:hypothetical protein